MIEYEINSSPFFVANKAYCEQIESRLKGFGYEYSGFCNSYGYEIETNFTRENLLVNVKFIKHEIKGGDYTGLELSIEGFDKNYFLTDKQLESELDNKMQDNIDYLKIKNGNIKIKIHSASIDVFELINQIYKSVSILSK